MALNTPNCNKQKKACLDQSQFPETVHSSPLGINSEPDLLDTDYFQPGLDWPGGKKSK